MTYSQLCPSLIAGADHFIDFIQIQRHGLLAHDPFHVLGSVQDDLAVAPMPRANADYIEVFLFQHLHIVGVEIANIELLAVLRELLLAYVRCRDDLSTLTFVISARMMPGDAACPNDPCSTYFVCHDRTPSFGCIILS